MSVLRLIGFLTVLVLLAPSFLSGQAPPSRLSDSTFWALFRGMSETTGGFASENFTSNEAGAAWIVPDLRREVPAGRAYLGVGPEQNFTYIAALRPSVAFLLDIRSQAALQHLLYKALFELAPDRNTFLSLLFSRGPVTAVDSTTSVAELIEAYRTATPSLARFDSTLQRVLDHLGQQHGFDLSFSEQEEINHIFQITFLAGPRLNYNAGRLIPKRPASTDGLSRLRMETVRRGALVDTTWYLVSSPLHSWASSSPVSTLWYEPLRNSGQVVLIDTTRSVSLGTTATPPVVVIERPSPATSGVDFAALTIQEDSLGVAQGFLSTEAAYRSVRDMHQRNLIVPVVGDFAGPTALRGIGKVLHEWQTPIGAFYVSNVEEYLFHGDAWSRFYQNVTALPHDDRSLFIRAFLGERLRASRSQPGLRVDLALGSISSLLKAFRAGKISAYADLAPLSQQ